MTYPFKLSLIWLLGGTIAVLFSLTFLPDAMVGDHYIPAGGDSFYHAQRIIPTIKDSSAFYEYDHDSYVPEGTWIAWPWAYDYMLAMATRLFMKVSGITDPMSILTYIPVLWLYINTGLILGIGVVLRLRIFHLILLVLCFSFSPLTKVLHGAGRIDHHFMEYTAVLATLLFCLMWIKRPESRYRAIFLGMVLGFSPGIQNGLFILQLPVLLSFFVLWIRGEFPGTKNIYYLVASFLISTFLLLIPSEPFRDFLFSYYLLSWFHALVAVCTIFAILYFKYVSFSWKNLVWLGILSLILASPLLTDILSGLGFIGGGGMQGLKDIGEARSAFGLSAGNSTSAYYNILNYSLLLYLTPFVIVWASYLLYKKPGTTLTVFYVFTIFGLVMLSMQFRLHYFGSFALYIPILLVLSRMKPTSTKKIVIANLAVIIFFAISYYPTYINLVTSPGWNKSYAIREKMYERLGQACKDDPGVALVTLNDAHMVTFLTSCKVVANNMFINQEQAKARMDVEKYYNSSAAELIKIAPLVKYVVVEMPPDLLLVKEKDKDKLWQQHRRLERELMWELKELPEGYKLIDEVVFNFTDDDSKLVYMRLFKITHSNNDVKN